MAYRKLGRYSEARQSLLAAARSSTTDNADPAIERELKMLDKEELNSSLNDLYK